MTLNRLRLHQRDLQPELMDELDLNETDHRFALDGLRRLNSASGASRRMCNEIVAYSRLKDMPRVRILDIASGGGDVAMSMWAQAKHKGLDLQIRGLDISATACDYANERCRDVAGSLVFEQCDVMRENIPTGFDIVTCSLFLHHLTDDHARSLLAKMAAAGQLLLVNDLRRCMTGYLIAQLACHSLTRSPIVRYDGPQSVVNAFTQREMRQLCIDAGLKDATVQKIWPFRLLVKRRSA